MNKIKTGSKVTIIASGVTGTLGDYNRSKRKYEITDKGFKVIGMFARSEFIDEVAVPTKKEVAPKNKYTEEDYMKVGAVYHHKSDRKELNYTVIESDGRISTVQWIDSTGNEVSSDCSLESIRGYLKDNMISMVTPAPEVSTHKYKVGDILTVASNEPRCTQFRKGDKVVITALDLLETAGTEWYYVDKVDSEYKGYYLQDVDMIPFTEPKENPIDLEYPVGTTLRITIDKPQSANLSKGDIVTVIEHAGKNAKHGIVHRVRKRGDAITWLVYPYNVEPVTGEVAPAVVDKSMFHAMILAELDLKAGDTIRIVRKVPHREFGWDNSWNHSMDRYIGEEGVVMEASNEGIKTSIDPSYRFPAQGVELVSRAPVIKTETVYIGADGDRDVIISNDGTIRSAGESLNIEQLRKLHSALISTMTIGATSPWSINIATVDIGCCKGVTRKDITNIIETFQRLNPSK